MTRHQIERFRALRRCAELPRTLTPGAARPNSRAARRPSAGGPALSREEIHAGGGKRGGVMVGAFDHGFSDIPAGATFRLEALPVARGFGRFASCAGAICVDGDDGVFHGIAPGWFRVTTIPLLSRRNNMSRHNFSPAGAKHLTFALSRLPKASRLERGVSRHPQRRHNQGTTWTTTRN